MRLNTDLDRARFYAVVVIAAVSEVLGYITSNPPGGLPDWCILRCKGRPRQPFNYCSNTSQR